MSAKETGNMSATAKRSATSIRHLIKCLDDLAEQDKTTLAKAATILLKHGNRAKDKAAAEKRSELARERAQAKARGEAQRIIAAWPQTATLDRVALIHATRAGADRLARREDEDDPRWEINYATQEAIADLVSDAVMHAVPWSDSTRGAVPVDDTMSRVRVTVDQTRMRPGIVALAAKWDARLVAYSVIPCQTFVRVDPDKPC